MKTKLRAVATEQDIKSKFESIQNIMEECEIMSNPPLEAVIKDMITTVVVKEEPQSIGISPKPRYDQMMMYEALHLLEVITAKHSFFTVTVVDQGVGFGELTIGLYRKGDYVGQY